MEFILPFNIKDFPSKICYTDTIMLIGSCFTEEIGKLMQQLKFNVCINPNGILYDPLSISSALTSYVQNKKFTAGDLFQLNELWQSWQHHSSFSGLHKEEVLKKINYSQSRAHDFLKTVSWIIITPGTSYSYKLLQSSIPVANCHKAPQHFFEKKLMPMGDIISSLSAAITGLQIFNPPVKIIFTVSPVRHIRDGIVENNRSKARLIEAIQTIEEENNNVFYFPSYELVIDILRDYRFYKDDLVHPSTAAIEFVFENFCTAFIDEQSKTLLKKIKEIINAAAHRPFHKESVAHTKFINSILEKIEKINLTFPMIDFSTEMNLFANSNV